MGCYWNIFLTSETISTRNKLELEILESVFLVCKTCSLFGLVCLLFDFLWFWCGVFFLCIFNVFYIQDRLNLFFSIFLMNCKLPLSCSLAVRLAFLSPDMSALRTGKWNGTQCILTELFQAWTVDLQKNATCWRFYVLVCKDNSYLSYIFWL